MQIEWGSMGLDGYMYLFHLLVIEMLQILLSISISIINWAKQPKNASAVCLNPSKDNIITIV